jgi:hypothetical protein
MSITVVMPSVGITKKLVLEAVLKTGTDTNKNDIRYIF